MCFTACQRNNKEKNPTIPSTAKKTTTSETSAAPNKGLDTLVNGSRYRFEIIDGAKDQLKVEKIKNGQSKSLTIEAPKDRLYLSAILFDQQPRPRFSPLQVFSEELFAFGTFDQELQKIWMIRDLAEGLKIEELDANRNAMVNRGRYLIYVPEEEILALPQIPEQIEGTEKTVVHRYRINQENMILRLKPDTVVQN
jgi:hypothetical protein